VKYFPLVLSLLAAFVCCLLSALGVLPPGVTTGVLVALPLPGLDALWRALGPVLRELRARAAIETVTAEPLRPELLHPAQQRLPTSTAVTLDAPPERAALQELLRHQQAEDNAQTIEARCLAKVGRQRAAAAATELLRALALMLMILIPVLAVPGCAALNGYLASLKNCGVQLAPAGVQAGVSLALSRGAGWEAALASLLGTYGECLVKAEVQRHADGAGPEPPRVQAAALATLLPPDLTAGELGAAPSAVSADERRARARAWLDKRARGVP